MLMENSKSMSCKDLEMHVILKEGRMEREEKGGGGIRLG